MRSRFTLALLVGLLCLASPCAADEPDTADPLAGKIALIFLDAEGVGYPLMNAKIQKLGGREFIVGLGADSQTDGDWIKGTTLRIALDRIAVMATYTPKEWEKHTANVNARKGKRGEDAEY